MKQLLESSSIVKLNSEQIFDFFEKIGHLGDIIIYRLDGIREKEHKYTSIIISSNMAFETIRKDGDSLVEAISKSIEAYKRVCTDAVNCFSKLSISYKEAKSIDSDKADVIEKKIAFFESVGRLGDLIAYKMDGPRENNKYTIIIASNNETFETIRHDGSSLESLVISAIGEYKQVRPDFEISESHSEI